MGGTEGYIPVGAGPKGTVEGAALGGSPDGTEGGALGLFQGLEPGQPCAWAGFVLLTEVLAGECSGSASANENSSDIFLNELWILWTEPQLLTGWLDSGQANLSKADIAGASPFCSEG